MNSKVRAPQPSPANRPRRFGAPWSRSLKVISALAVLLLLGIGVGLGGAGVPNPVVRWTSAVATLLLLTGTALFIIRGYSLRGSTLKIHRLLWATRVSLESLRGARVDPTAVEGSLRLFGNGGLFSYTGWFRNRRLGTYRLFATDLRRTVVLDLGRRRIVVSPDDPEAFVAALPPMDGAN